MRGHNCMCDQIFLYIFFKFTNLSRRETYETLGGRVRLAIVRFFYLSEIKFMLTTYDHDLMTLVINKELQK